MTLQLNPGPIVLFGSGETSPSGQKTFDRLFRRLPDNPRVSLLETPAGFELNSAEVAGRVAAFLDHHLQNYHPKVQIIPARQRGTPYSPDSEKIAAPLLKSDLIFAGPGSPSYTVRQLENSLTWQYLIARHRLGAALAFSSAAVIALSVRALPVYEIYKVGEDLHWKPGLDFFGAYGLPLVFVTHWNNNDGGSGLDTSRCFLGQKRFEVMLDMLPPELIIIGIDEHTALWLDCVNKYIEVSGIGNVTIIKGREQQVVSKGETVLIQDLMECETLDPTFGIPAEIMDTAQTVAQTLSSEERKPPQGVLELMEQRKNARLRKDWAVADEIRDQIAARGWLVKDTPDGPVLEKI